MRWLRPAWALSRMFEVQPRRLRDPLRDARARAARARQPPARANSARLGVSARASPRHRHDAEKLEPEMLLTLLSEYFSACCHPADARMARGVGDAILAVWSATRAHHAAYDDARGASGMKRGPRPSLRGGVRRAAHAGPLGRLQVAWAAAAAAASTRRAHGDRLRRQSRRARPRRVRDGRRRETRRASSSSTSGRHARARLGRDRRREASSASSTCGPSIRRGPRAQKNHGARGRRGAARIHQPTSQPSRRRRRARSATDLPQSPAQPSPSRGRAPVRARCASAATRWTATSAAIRERD